MTQTTPKELFTPVRVGAVELKHRVVLPPMSRLRGLWPSGKPSDLMHDYYTQRASDGGLIMTEANAVSPIGRAYHTGPGIWSDEQADAWSEIVDSVHAKGGVFFMQFTHAGRATGTGITEVAPVTASVNPEFWANQNIVVSTPDGLVLPSPHRALETDEVRDIVEQYRVAAENAKRAGFDGIEILAGNGHLVEQFLHDGSNKRDDVYGGSVENRVRFLVEILEAVTTVWDADRVGVRISPSSVFNGMGDSDPQALYNHLAERLNAFGLAYLHVIEPRISGADTVAPEQPPIAAAGLGKIFNGTIIAAGGFNAETAEEAVANGVAQLVSIGRWFTSNPDLPRRIQLGLPLTQYDRNTFYAFDAKGYTDWAEHAELEEAVAA